MNQPIKTNIGRIVRSAFDKSVATTLIVYAAIFVLGVSQFLPL